MPMSELSTTLGSYEVRFVLEAEAARLAATRRTAQEMAHVEEGMALLREALLSSEPAHAEDMDLHRRIAAATGNLAFIQAFDALWPDVEKIMRAGVDISRSRPPPTLCVKRRPPPPLDAIRTIKIV